MQTSTPEVPQETIIIDENFSTANIEIGQEPVPPQIPDLSNILKTFDSTGLMNLLSNTSNNDSDNESINKFANMLNKLKNVTNENHEEIANIFQDELGIDMNQIKNDMEKIINNNN